MQAQQAQPQTQSIRVLRAFYYQGKPTKVDEILDLPRLFALELQAAKKVEFVQQKAEEKPEPKKAETKTTQKAFI